MINYALPGTIVGIAYLIAFNAPPIEITGTALIIIACYVFRYSPTGIRATVAQLEQIDRSIEEASLSLGARSGTTFRRITLPLIMPAFFAGLGVVFITHNIQHAFPVGDTFTILNRGRGMGTFAKAEIGRDEVQAMMAGGKELFDLEAELRSLGSRPAA